MGKSRANVSSGRRGAPPSDIFSGTTGGAPLQSGPLSILNPLPGGPLPEGGPSNLACGREADLAGPPLSYAIEGGTSASVGSPPVQPSVENPALRPPASRAGPPPPVPSLHGAPQEEVGSPSVEAEAPFPEKQEQRMGAPGGSMEAWEMAEELKHLAAVRRAFSLYEADALCDIARIETHLLSLSDDDRRLLGPPSPEERVSAIRQAVAVNQQFIDLMLLAAASVGPCTPREGSEACSEPDIHSNSNDQQQQQRQQQQQQQQQRQQQQQFAKHGKGQVLARKRRRKKQQQKVDQQQQQQHEQQQRCPQGHSGCCSSEPEGQRRLLSEAEQEDPDKLTRNMSKVRSTLRQFVRDWAEDGAEEREAAYGPLLAALEEYLPLVPGQKPPRVLCPGSGLGRLPFEVMRRGYACQGNEFSYFMLIGSDFVLNSRLAPKSLPLQPYCLSTSNRRTKGDHLEVVWIPDVAPSEHVSPSADFSMCAGEFVEVYGGSKSCVPATSRTFDCVLTSFFLDTAKNVLVYIKTIARVLHSGGLWANIGPLLYHFADMPQEMSVEFAADEILAVVANWFNLLRVDWRDCYYTSNRKSMMQVQYHCLYFVAIRNDVPPPEIASGTTS